MLKNTIFAFAVASALCFAGSVAAQELTDEFSVSFSDYPAVNRMVLASTLDEETRNLYAIPENNVVGSDEDGKVYRAHMANNSYVWDKQEDGSYEKAYGGIDGFYGYFHHENKVKTYAVTNSTIEKDSVSILNMADGVLQISALGNSGYNLYGSFGRYDLNLGGSFVYNTTLAKLGVNNGKSVVTMSLVQNKASDSDKCTGEYHFLKIDANYDIYFDGAASPCGKIERGASFNSVPQFYDISYYMDNSGEVPSHALVIKKSGTDEVVASVDMQPISQSNTSYDFSQPHGGIRVKNEGKDEWSGNARLLFKSMSFGQIEPLTVLTDKDSFAVNPLIPGDDNQLMEINFSKELSENTEGVKLIDENGEEKRITVMTDGSSTLRIVPEPLEGTRRYTLVLSDIISKDFSVCPEQRFPVVVKDYVEIVNATKTAGTSGKRVRLDFTVKNNSAVNEKCCIFVAVSDKNGKMRQGRVYYNFAELDAVSDTDFAVDNVMYSDETDIYRVYVLRDFLQPVALGDGITIR